VEDHSRKSDLVVELEFEPVFGIVHIAADKITVIRRTTIRANLVFTISPQFILITIIKLSVTKVSGTLGIVELFFAAKIVVKGAYMEKRLPILEHDYERPAVIEPTKVISSITEMPERAVILFYQGVIESLLKKGLLKKISDRRSEVGLYPVYEIEYKAVKVAILNPGLGAPSAAGFYEELIALGVRKTIACGSCGVLKRDIPRGEIIVVESAVRDEGTSYHYLEPSREITVDSEVLEKIEATLEASSIPYIKGKTWTTDAFYRETKKIVKERIDEGCITVEMEASALMAVSKFRDVVFGQLLSSGDDVSGEEWDRRFHPESASHKERVFWAAIECCLRI
jgi:uridine phosphorylase